ncbi:hypothetical protein ESB00_08105 [Oleiharenicola lentus]|uniref:Uncharacterized protein n=1 Tax=Oleiharenicola lentus TaxID=2508720 RepID=A0A4Q1CA07_9BACT|nr:hypothetical protein [Oleiharenicola lentus]RXK55834.1 hypothetical protein ESB00_08105 [Oleiharenicola lentus]
MQPAQPPPSSPAKPVNWGILGAMVGGFIGIVADKFALGLIFGFLIGLMIGSAKRKTAASDSTRPPGDEK